MHCYSIVWMLCFVASGLAGSGTTPSFIKPCSASDPELNQCIENVIRSVGQRFADGIPELGVAPLDPLKLDVININNPSLKLVFKNTSVDGLREFKLNSLRMSVPKSKVILDFTVNVTLKGQYEMDGQILILPIRGNGDAKIKITNLTIILKYDFETRHNFWLVTSYTSTHRMDRAQFKFLNLFNGSKHLEDATNRFLNENWEMIMQELAPPAILQIIRKCVDEVNKFFSAIPAASLLTA